MLKFDHPLQQDLELWGSFIQDRDGFFWMGSKNGLIKYNGMSVKVYKKGADSLTGSTICSLLEDRDGILWIGTTSGGLNKYDED